MAIEKKLIEIKTKAIFNAKLNANEINNNSIVFIKDTGEIWTHGKIYAGNGHGHSNYVTLDTEQTITGLKHFTGNNNFTGINNFSKISLQTLPTSQPICINGINNSASNGYLPAIGFHIPGITYSSIALSRDGDFLFLDNTMNSCRRIISSSFRIPTGTSSQFLKADGSVDGNAYSTTSHTHSYASLTNLVVAGNEHNWISAGYSGAMWINHQDKDARNSSALISDYNFGNGRGTWAPIRTSGFILNGSNNSYLLTGGGSHVPYHTGIVANTVVQRDGAADISCRIVRENFPDENYINGGVVFRVNNGGDNYLRICNNKTAITNWLGVSLSGHTHDYLPLTGGTLSGGLQVRGFLFAYNYINSNNTAAIGIDKPGAACFGIGPDGTVNRIKYGSIVSVTNSAWANNNLIQHYFEGSSIVFNGTPILHQSNWQSIVDGRYVFNRVRTNWSDDTVIDNVVGQLAWKFYGNDHTIFDASKGTTPSGTACNNMNSAQPWIPQYPTLIGWNGVDTYGVRVDSCRMADNSTTVSGYTIRELFDTVSLRNFPSGTLIKTNIDYTSANGDPFLLEITGNSYGNKIPMDIKVQGYIYSNTIINYGGIATGHNINTIVALLLDSKLCFWMATQGYWQGYTARCYIPVNSNNAIPINKVVSIINSTDPGGSKRVSIDIRQVATTLDNVASATILQTTRTIFGQSFNGSQNVTGTVFTNSGLKSRNICIETDVNGAAADCSSEINNYASTLCLQHRTTNNVALSSGGGKVCIGAYAPEYKLDVRGNFRVTDTGIFGGSLTADTLTSRGVQFYGNSTAFRIQTPHGASWFGMQNAGYCHIYTEAPEFYFNKELRSNNHLVLHDSNYSNYALPLSGGIISGSLTASSFIKSGGNSAQLLRADGGIASFNWAGQGGQPTWLWGGNSNYTYYLYNPSNFRVANAETVGDVGIANLAYGYNQRGHVNSSTAYTGESYISTFVPASRAAFTERGTWNYAGNGYVTTDFGNIHLAGTSIITFGNASYGSSLYITPLTASISNALTGEMLFYTKNQDYPTGWTRVLTNRNYTSIIDSRYVIRGNDVNVLSNHVRCNYANGLYMNWEWGNTTPTHIWGSKGSSTQTYLFNSDNIRNFANAVSRAGDTMTGGLTSPAINSTGHIWSSGDASNDQTYGYISVMRNNTINNATAFAWVRGGITAFGIGHNTSNQIVIGIANSNKTISPWVRFQHNTVLSDNLYASDSNGLVQYNSGNCLLASQTGTTYIRSGATNLQHRFNGTDYAIWDTRNFNPASYSPTSHNHDGRYWMVKTGCSSAVAHYSTTSTEGTGILVRIPYQWSTGNSWMISFTLRVYESYRYYDIAYSGYNYSGNKWYSPLAKMISGNRDVVAKFGWGDDGYLYVWCEGNSYVGATIFNVNNGYTQYNWDTSEWIISRGDCPHVQWEQVLRQPVIHGETVDAASSVPWTGVTGKPNLVLDTDSRLSNARPASDVYSWAKQSSKPSYSYSEVGAMRNIGRIVSDCNAADFRTSGSYGFAAAPSNGPGMAYASMLVSNNSDVGLQIVGGYIHNRLAFRGWGSYGATYGGWLEVLHSGNYNNYSPSKTGGGASGTWGISISGNAASAYGLAVHGGRNNEANKVVRTDASGYLQTGYINSESGGNEHNSGNPTYVWGTNGSDNYLRTYNRANLAVNTANLSTKSYKTDQLEAYTAAGFSGGDHYVRAIRESGWTTRLYMGYYRDGTLQDSIKVNYANSSNYANSAGSATNATNAANVLSSDWLRTTGNVGWYSETYGGGIYMTDSTWVKTYNGKNFLCEAMLQTQHLNVLGTSTIGYIDQLGDRSSNYERVAFVIASVLIDIQTGGNFGSSVKYNPKGLGISFTTENGNGQWGVNVHISDGNGISLHNPDSDYGNYTVVASAQGIGSESWQGRYCPVWYKSDNDFVVRSVMGETRQSGRIRATVLYWG